METNFKLPESEISKIEKILALSRNNPNPNEAATAAAMAAKILQQYNLEVSEFELKFQSTKNSVPSVNEIGYDLEEAESRSLPLWLASLITSVAKACLCQPLRSYGSVSFIGRKREAETAKMIFSELYTQMKVNSLKSAKEKAKSFRSENGFEIWDFKGHGKKKFFRDWTKSWLEGCADGIKLSLQKQTEEFEQQGGSALMIVRGNEIAEYLKTKNIGTKTVPVTHHKTFYSHAYEQGKFSGQQMAQNHTQKKLHD